VDVVGKYLNKLTAWSPSRTLAISPEFPSERIEEQPHAPALNFQSPVNQSRALYFHLSLHGPGADFRTSQQFALRSELQTFTAIRLWQSQNPVGVFGVKLALNIVRGPQGKGREGSYHQDGGRAEEYDRSLPGNGSIAPGLILPG
jgi:hypothetical protein